MCLGQLLCQLVVLADHRGQLGVALNDQLHFPKAVRQLVVLLDVVLEHLLHLQPLLLLLLHEELLALKFLLKLLQVGLEDLLVFQGAL